MANASWSQLVKDCRRRSTKCFCPGIVEILENLASKNLWKLWFISVWKIQCIPSMSHVTIWPTACYLSNVYCYGKMVPLWSTSTLIFRSYNPITGKMLQKHHYLEECWWFVSSDFILLLKKNEINAYVKNLRDIFLEELSCQEAKLMRCLSFSSTYS